MKKEFKQVVGTTGTFFVGMSNDHVPEVYHISKLNGDTRINFISFDRIEL